MDINTTEEHSCCQTEMEESDAVIQKVANEYQFSCSKCDRSFKQRSHVRAHLKTHRGYKCEKCDLPPFLTWSALRRHVSQAHPNRPQCSECLRSFRRLADLRKHVQSVHSKMPKLGCPVHGCDVKLAQWTVEAHLKKDHPETVQSTSVKKTLENGAKVREFHCSIEDCGAIFNMPCRLQSHVRNVHEKDDASTSSQKSTAIFPCPFCEKWFSKNYKLQNHLNWHNGIKPFKCPLTIVVGEGGGVEKLCAKSYITRNSLKRHLLEQHGRLIDSVDVGNGDGEVTYNEALGDSGSDVPTSNIEDAAGKRDL